MSATELEQKGLGENTLAEVQDIVRDVLDKPELNLTRQTLASSVRDWDSLAHVRIIVAVEKRFGIRFDLDQLESLENVGALCDAVDNLAVRS